MTTYRYFLGQFAAGGVNRTQLLGEVFLEDPKMNWVLSGAGALTGKLTCTGREGAPARAIVPGLTMIYAERNSRLIWAGVITGYRWDASGFMDIRAQDYAWFLTRRVYYSPLTRPTVGADRLLADVVPEAVTIPVVGENATNGWPPNLRLVSTGVDATQTVSVSDDIADDNKSVMDFLLFLAEQDPGLDFRFTPYWHDDLNPRVLLEVAAPRLGKAVEETGSAFVFPGSITDLDIDVDVNEMLNRVLVVGSVGDTENQSTAVEVRELPASSALRIEGVVVLDSTVVAGSLARVADAIAPLRYYGKAILSMTVRADVEPSFDRFNVGDDVSVLIQDTNSPMYSVTPRVLRIGEKSLDPVTEQVTIVPWSPDGNT